VEISTPCGAENCKQRFRVVGPFSSAIFEAQKKLMAEHGWRTVTTTEGKERHYCPEHAEDEERRSE
jgi:hypothetical protein